MKPQHQPFVPWMTRRQFAVAGAASLAGAVAACGQEPAGRRDDSPDGLTGNPPRKLRVAAVNSIFRLRSHAYHIVGRMVHGFQKDGFHHQPELQVVRMYDDQQPENDLGPGFCERHGIELCRTVAETLGRGGDLDVDAVALIIEHGDYPLNELGQIEYPRYQFFQQLVEVFRRSRRVVPVFVDKHLSYDHVQAAGMVATAKKLGIPLMAGSSLPVTWRIPQLELPRESPLTEGVVTFGYDRGPAEIYLFHALEVLQCMLERRGGGESGVRSVVCLEGDAVWRAIDQGRISGELVNEAIGRSPSANVGPLRENVAQPLAIVIDYADGTRGAVLNLIEAVSDFAFAGRLEGRAKPVSSCFSLPSPPGARFFDPLTWNIEQFFHGRQPYPVERTLLTSTVLDLALRSRKDDSRTVESPYLDVRYQPPETSGFFRGPIMDRH
jgi:hypothetical protein